MRDQKSIFLEGEGDAWYARNKVALAARKLPGDDAVLTELISIFPCFSELRILEVGCGGGERLVWLKSQGADVCGIDPSKEAIDIVVGKGVKANVGTADKMPYESNIFDIVIVGFCLYLCDRHDLFKISAEVDRVLKPNAWVVILDFYSKTHASNAYAHAGGLSSFKMDYSSIFTWHPYYFLVVQKIIDHNDFRNLTDVEDDMMSLQVLRKKSE
ncbi:MAG: class I SAM-dependent methyltransferase [Mariprofundaceae bacterium]|nr:class I SAM-dependent methyltransferase [Mariprofundaceae bacterium]